VCRRRQLQPTLYLTVSYNKLFSLSFTIRCCASAKTLALRRVQMHPAISPAAPPGSRILIKNKQTNKQNAGSTVVFAPRLAAQASVDLSMDCYMDCHSTLLQTRHPKLISDRADSSSVVNTRLVSCQLSVLAPHPKLIPAPKSLTSAHDVMDQL